MKEKDLIKDAIYQFHYDYNSNGIINYYIGKIKNNGSDFIDSYIDITSSNFITISAYMCSAIKNCIPATPEQVRWFNACTKANKFIPLNEVKTNTDEYEIY